MSHFYGAIQGQAGEATRMGSKRSGYRAWAQDGTVQVAVHLSHNHRTERTEASIAIRNSTQNYKSGSVLVTALDLTALWGALGDKQVQTALIRAEEQLHKANNRAIMLAERGRK